MKPCKRCQKPFKPRGSNHLYCGDMATKTGCSWENRQAVGGAYAKKYREAKRIGRWPDGKRVPATRRCVDCKEPFVVKSKAYRQARCEQCAPVRHRKMIRENYYKKTGRTEPRKSPPRPTPYIYKPKPCRFCEKPFQPTNGKTKYCSEYCTYEAQRVQIGEHHARRKAQARAVSRRQRDYEKRSNSPLKKGTMPIVRMTQMPVEQILRNWDRFFGAFSPPQKD